MNNVIKQNKINCAIYTSEVRNLDVDQFNDSLKLQEEACRASIESHTHLGCVFYKSYCDFVDDPRPSLNKMLTDIKTGKIKCVVVYSLDKIGSNSHYLYKHWNFFKQYGVKLIPITSIHDKTYDGNLSKSQFVHFSSFESDVLNMKRVVNE